MSDPPQPPDYQPQDEPALDYQSPRPAGGDAVAARAIQAQTDPHTAETDHTSEHAAQFETLDPALRKVWRVGGLLQALFFGAVVAAAEIVFRNSGDALEMIPPAIPTVLAVALLIPAGLIYAELSFKRWRFALREHDLVARYGVWWRTRRCVPRLRVQHVDINSGPILRAFGLVELSVYTAGTIAAVISVPGLRPERAETLRDELLKTEREHV